jgi:hypothetical protein
VSVGRSAWSRAVTRRFDQFDRALRFRSRGWCVGGGLQWSANSNTVMSEKKQRRGIYRAVSVAARRPARWVNDKATDLKPSQHFGSLAPYGYRVFDPCLPLRVRKRRASPNGSETTFIRV